MLFTDDAELSVAEVHYVVLNDNDFDDVPEEMHQYRSSLEVLLLRNNKIQQVRFCFKICSFSTVNSLRSRCAPLEAQDRAKSFDMLRLFLRKFSIAPCQKSFKGGKITETFHSEGDPKRRPIGLVNLRESNKNV